MCVFVYVWVCMCISVYTCFSEYLKSLKFEKIQRIFCCYFLVSLIYNWRVYNGKLKSEWVVRKQDSKVLIIGRRSGWLWRPRFTVMGANMCSKNTAFLSKLSLLLATKEPNESSWISQLFTSEMDWPVSQKLMQEQIETMQTNAFHQQT